jgi:hypothetical protein
LPAPPSLFVNPASSTFFTGIAGELTALLSRSPNVFPDYMSPPAQMIL